jgi:capsular exopolysaccharide synthesis family protein
MSSFLEFSRKPRIKPDPGASSAMEALSKATAQPLDLEEIPAEEVTLQPESRVIFHSDPHSSAADRFRYLRMRLREFWNTGRLKTLLITSPLPADGKSTTALNLATALSEKGRRRVLLIEADLYHSPLQQLLGLEERKGFAECLESGLSPERAIRRLASLEWFLLPAGKANGNPTELLHGEAVGQVIHKLLPRFDWLLIDSPPVIPLVDALLLKQHCNATLLVARAGHTPASLIEKSISLIGHENILGLVFNGVEQLDRKYSKYSKYYSYYAPKDGN